MSSRHSVSSDRLPQGRRIIAPLPRRSRGSSHPGNSQNLLSTNGSLSQNSDLSPPAPDVSQIAFQFGQSGNNSLPTERQVTPRPSPEPEDTRLSSFQDSSTAFNGSSLPTLSTRDHDISQPLPTMFSDEKIAVLATGDHLERGIPTIVRHYSDTAAGTHRTSFSRPATALSLPHVLSSSPSLDVLRPRSVSDVSDVSDNNDNISPYDVRDEEAPLETFFTPVFQTALQNGLSIANKVDTAIETLFGSSQASSDLERLLKDARRLGIFQSSDTRTIAVLGDSGEGNCGGLRRITAIAYVLIGKSSLINALLHFPEIAKTVRWYFCLTRFQCLLSWTGRYRRSLHFSCHWI